MRGLISSLIREQEITTTLARAKEIRSEAEKLITRAKKGGLFNRRLIIARLGDLEAATLLVDKIAPQIKRDSGYLRITRAGFRRGDNAEMGTIAFVDEISFEADADTDAKKAAPAAKKAPKVLPKTDKTPEKKEAK